MFTPDTVHNLRNIGRSLIMEIFRWPYTHRDWKTSQNVCSAGHDCQLQSRNATHSTTIFGLTSV